MHSELKRETKASLFPSTQSLKSKMGYPNFTFYVETKESGVCGTNFITFITGLKTSKVVAWEKNRRNELSGSHFFLSYILDVSNENNCKSM